MTTFKLSNPERKVFKLFVLKLHEYELADLNVLLMSTYIQSCSSSGNQ